jgi:RNA polymerase sigma-70 factor, ECF subfamily
MNLATARATRSRPTPAVTGPLPTSAALPVLAALLPSTHPVQANDTTLAANDEPVAVSWPEMVSHRSYLVRFAQRKLRDPMQAEDAVHDVFEAVLSGRARFAGRSALRSWLTAVLKHKIIDIVRRSAGMDTLDDEDSEHGLLALECPHARPDELADHRQQLAHTLARIEALPAGLRDAMRLRVLEDRPTDQVCASLGISEDNLFVRMHRARKQLLS